MCNIYKAKSNVGGRVIKVLQKCGFLICVIEKLQIIISAYNTQLRSYAWPHAQHRGRRCCRIFRKLIFPGRIKLIDGAVHL